jgi:bifunctional UDP-N-acetylglucosamine pyrophosphorylase/glucosamine-1-phosphate N-acetyltransferase
VQAVSQLDVIGVNTRQHLAEVDAIMQSRIHSQLRDQGVTITDSQTTYIESGVTVGPDTCIYPFTFIGRDSNIGAECVIGPFATLPRESILIEGSSVSGNISFEKP